MADDVKLPGAKMIDGQRTTISDEHVHSARGDLAANEDHNESEDRKESATSNDNEGHKDALEQVDLNAAMQSWCHRVLHLPSIRFLGTVSNTGTNLKFMQRHERYGPRNVRNPIDIKPNRRT